MKTRGRKFKFDEVEIRAHEKWKNPIKMVEALHTKISNNSINKGWEVQISYSIILNIKIQSDKPITGSRFVFYQLCL